MQSTQSIDRAAWLNKFALIGYIGSLVVVAILTFLSWWAGSHLQNVIQKDADARIAEADSKAAAANENAGKANERAGVANERAQKLENDNVQLRTDLENATADAKSKIEGARAEANVKIEQARTEAARQVGEVQKDVEEQRERAAKAEKDLLEFKQRFRDRHLSDTDRKSITAMLRRGLRGLCNSSAMATGLNPATLLVK